MKNIKRGQVWEIDLTPTKGAEMEKVRPCVVVSSDTLGVLPLRLVVPITE
jgi:mRNA interferase MazF